jgi:ATP-binding cassette subfamily C protein
MIDKELLGLTKDGKKILFSVLLKLVGTVLNLITTASICIILSYASGGLKEKSSYIILFFIMLACLVGNFVIQVVTGNFKSSLGSKVKSEFRSKLFNKLLRLGTSETATASTAGLTQLTSEGIEQLELYFSVYLPQFFYAMAAPILLFAVYLIIDFRTALVLLVCVPLIPLSIIAVSKYAKRVFAKYWGQYTDMGSDFLDSIQGLRELKIFGTDHIKHRKMNQNAENFRKITMKVLVMQLASVTIMDTVAFGGSGIGIITAVTSAISGNITPFEALFLSLGAIEFFLPLRVLGSAFHVAMNGVSAGRKIISILNEPEPKWDHNKIGKITEIRAENVSFSYDKQNPILRYADMSFKRGELTAIVGKSGSGKSIITKLLMGIISPDNGQINCISDNRSIELHRLSRENYYSKIGIVRANTYLFNLSFFENFRLVNPQVTHEQIRAALEKVNMSGFIEQNGGLHKPLAEDASNISGGQKQRIALALSLTLPKEIYIFDEVTSNVDSESEKIIMDNIYKLKTDAAVIVITHRLINIADADCTYTIADNSVKEAVAV